MITRVESATDRVEPEQQDDSEKVYSDNIFFFINVLRSLRKAQEKIQIDTYIFQDDRLGQLFLRELDKAAKRGVQVYLTLDGLGSYNFINSALIQDLHPNINVRIYNLLPWPFIKFLFFVPGSSLRKFFYYLKHINRRNHKKIIMIDNHVAFLGSHNIFLQAIHWRECSVQLKEPAVLQDIQAILSWSWRKADSPNPKIFMSVEPRLETNQLYFSLHSRTRRTLLKSIKKRLRTAQDKIQITTPYFMPPLNIVNKLNRAAKRGVLVEVIISKRTDTFLFPRISHSLYKTLLAAGVKIYEYQGAILHAKQICIDNWTIVGSSNMNTRSLFRDLELDYCVQQSQNIQKMSDMFETDKLDSEQIHFANLKNSYWHLFTSYLIGKLLGAWL